MRRAFRHLGAASLALVVIDYAQQVADVDPRTARYLAVGDMAQRQRSRRFLSSCARLLDRIEAFRPHVDSLKKDASPLQGLSPNLEW